MIAMILHPQPPFDQRGDPLGGPQLRTVAVRQGPLRQETDQARLLLRRQSRGTAWSRLGLQRRGPAAAQRVAPTKHTAGVTSKPAGNLMQGELLPEQRNYAAPPLLQRLRRTRWSHRGTPI